MSDDMRPRPEGADADRDAPSDQLAIGRLQQEVMRLRLQLDSEVRTRRVVIVDEQGADRICLSADAGGGCDFGLFDADGFERSTLSADGDGGALRIAARPLGSDAMRIDVFARDPEDDAGAYVGVELIDAGNSVAGSTVLEAHPPTTWTAKPDAPT